MLDYLEHVTNIKLTLATLKVRKYGDRCLKLQLHSAIYRLRFYSNSLIHILSLLNSHSDVTSIQKNRVDKSHSVIVALDIPPDSKGENLLEAKGNLVKKIYHIHCMQDKK